MARSSFRDGQQGIETRQEAMHRISSGCLALRQEMADGGPQHRWVGRSQQRERYLIEDLRKDSLQGVTDKFSAYTAGACIEVSEQRIVQLAEHLTSPRHGPVNQPQSPEAADEEIISRWSEPRPSADELTSGFKQLCCMPASECPAHGATDRLGAWQLVETADTAGRPERPAGVSDSFGRHIP
jgi:hypothetical protein